MAKGKSHTRQRKRSGMRQQSVSRTWPLVLQECRLHRSKAKAPVWVSFLSVPAACSQLRQAASPPAPASLTCMWTSSLPQTVSSSGAGPVRYCSLYPKHLNQCLAHSRCSRLPISKQTQVHVVSPTYEIWEVLSLLTSYHCLRYYVKCFSNITSLNIYRNCVR